MRLALSTQNAKLHLHTCAHCVQLLFGATQCCGVLSAPKCAVFYEDNCSGVSLLLLMMTTMMTMLMIITYSGCIRHNASVQDNMMLLAT